MVDMVRLTLTEQRFEHGIGEDAAVEDVLEAVKRLFTTCMLIE